MSLKCCFCNRQNRWQEVFVPKLVMTIPSQHHLRVKKEQVPRRRNHPNLLTVSYSPSNEPTKPSQTSSKQALLSNAAEKYINPLQSFSSLLTRMNKNFFLITRIYKYLNSCLLRWWTRCLFSSATPAAALPSLLSPAIAPYSQTT